MGIGFVGKGGGAESASIPGRRVVVDNLAPTFIKSPIPHDIGLRADYFFIHIEFHLRRGECFFPDANFIDFTSEELIPMPIGADAKGFAGEL